MAPIVNKSSFFFFLKNPFSNIVFLISNEKNCVRVIRYAYPWWKEKEIDSEKKRKFGGCPLTPEETALTLRALDIDPSIQVYIAAGNIYGGERRMAAVRSIFPNLVS